MDKPKGEITFLPNTTRPAYRQVCPGCGSPFCSSSYRRDSDDDVPELDDDYEDEDEDEYDSEEDMGHDSHQHAYDRTRQRLREKLEDQIYMRQFQSKPTARGSFSLLIYNFLIFSI